VHDLRTTHGEPGGRITSEPGHDDQNKQLGMLLPTEHGYLKTIRTADLALSALV